MLKLAAPMMITSRLTAGVKIDDATISVSPSRNQDRDGKPYWNWYVDLANGKEFTGNDLAGWGGHREMLESILSFLSACGESRNYRTRTGREGEHVDMFEAELGQWCESHTDELSMVAMELEENPECCEAV